MVEEAKVLGNPFSERLKGLLTNWHFWAWTIGAVLVITIATLQGKERAGNNLGDAVNLFKCCILTWKALVIVLPAFLAAGAIVTFVPDGAVVRYLGRRTAKWKSYSIGSVTGMLLSVCSCNVVPIFMGILRRGAGLGPAYAFAYAAPAINIVTIVMVLQVVGPYFAVWRTLAVPIVSIIGGLTMALLFHKEDLERQKQADAAPDKLQYLASSGMSTGRALALVGIVISVLLFGAWEEMGLWVRDHIVAWVLSDATVNSINWDTTGIVLRILGALALMGTALKLSIKWYSKEEAVEWLRQTGLMFKTVLPIFIPAVIIIGLVVRHIPTTLILPTAGNPDAFVFGYPNGNNFLQVLAASVFGSIMYFPLLTEVAFVKGMLLQGMAIGPAMAILLAGPGLSLPGLILLNKVVGLRKTVAYFIVMTLLVSGISYGFGQFYGKYNCVCQQNKPALLNK